MSTGSMLGLMMSVHVDILCCCFFIHSPAEDHLSSVFCDYKSCCCEYMCTFGVRRLYFSWGNTQERTAESPGNSGFPVLRTLWSISQSGCVPASNIWGARWFCLCQQLVLSSFFGFGFTILGGTLTHACTNMQPHRGKDECSVMC